MSNFIQAELLKMKSSLSKKLFLAIPIFFLAFAIFSNIYAEQQPSTNVFLTIVYNLWPIFFLPVGLAMACSMNINQEKIAGDYKNIFSNNISLSKMFFSKVVVITVYQCISAVSIAVVSILGSLLIYKELPIISQVIMTTAFIIIVALPLIPFNLIVSQFIGVLITSLINLIGAVGSVFIALKSYFWILPWGSMLRVPAETMGIHPNGTHIESFNLVPDFHVLAIAMGASVVYFLILIWLSNKIFKRKMYI
ncbi:lantibiotic immunity ABC transporter MutE/EpiE family permease subunit [Oceanobacillus sp. AG]|uniref:lantibiotic immunity ABC transporter MutE/EpiE family permease subunit n=1 Tax=Oceanobacillus sp. AG TaxID=2681969 RepID=UPI0012EBC120|nr:lantibiotic immunity ABC transporter MutE/EpiE family permease subunit [Oceanobacillus sp. AG]